MKKFLGFVGVLGILLGMVKIADAKDIYVPGSYPTIQAAINAATNSDTVWVADGIYTDTGNENLTWSKKKITVRSENGPNNCIIDCQNSGRGFSFSNAGDCGTISGFTIRNGSASGGGGICCLSSSPTITNCTISGNNSTYGGGIFCDYSSPTFINCTISGNNATTFAGGGIYCSNSSSPTITNCTISENNAADYGGGIFCLASASPTITNCTISGNSANYGGGIYCEYSSYPTITNNIIISNTGYGIYEYDLTSDPPTNYNCFYNNTPYNYCNEGTTNVDDVNTIAGNSNNIFANPQFIGVNDFHFGSSSLCINTGSNTAPAISVTDKDGKPRIVNGIVDMGAYEYQGSQPLRITTTSLPYGIVKTYYQATLTATGGTPPYNWSFSNSLPPGLTFAANTGLISGTPTQSGSFTFNVQVTDNAGITASKELSIYIVSCPVTVHDASGNFSGIYTTIQAGIDACPTGGTVLVDAGTYRENISFKGKAITVKSLHGTTSTIIDGNESGSVVTFSSGEGTGSVLDGFTITNGFAHKGGGICCDSSSTTITNCTISYNSAGDGGGIYCYSSSPRIANCTINYNSAIYDGGGICCYSSSPRITNCTISHNSGYYSGGIYCSSSSPTATNCIISYNLANSGGSGISCYDSSSPTITNCTISNNSVTNSDSVIFCSSSLLTVVNSILWNDTPQQIYLNTGGNINITYSDIKDSWSGIGNLNVDPLFVGVSDYHLQSTSPCINAGFNKAVFVGTTTDFDGNPRFVKTIDMGAYEYQGTTTLQYGSLSIASTPSGVRIYLDSDDTGSVTTYTFTNISAEFHTIKLTLSGYEDWYGTATVIAESTTYIYATLTQTQSATINVPADYPTIQEAINAAIDGDTVLVDAGTWTENISFKGKAITVKSLHGTTSTIIDGNKKGSVVTFDSGEGLGSVLAGFTITNGSAPKGGGIYCGSSSTTITNCTISDNFANVGGGIYCNSLSSLLSYRTTITNCTISNNSAGRDGGGIYCNALSPLSLFSLMPAITNCTISNNSAMGDGGGIFCKYSSPMITNCIISYNKAIRGGGIYCYIIPSPLPSSPTITNCTISYNSVREDGGGIFCNSPNPFPLPMPSPTVTNCTISYNRTDHGNGGGIFCCSTSPMITNCIVSYNRTDHGNGGGIFCYNSSSSMITNCNISNNSANPYGGGIFCEYSSPTTTNCTISNNSATCNGGGIFCGTSSKPTVVNSIIFWNDIPPGIYVNNSSDITITHSDIEGGWIGIGNMNNDPLFVEKNNYRLQSTSYCIDRGSDFAADDAAHAIRDVIHDDDIWRWITRTDLDGNSRFVKTVDMGAYEHQGIPPLIITTTSLPSDTVNTYYQFTLTAAGGTPHYKWSYSGNLPPGLTLASNTGLISGTPIQSGSFTFTVQVADSGGSSEIKELSISIVSGTVTVHDASGNFIGTYPTIQAGIDACSTDGTVLVDAGIYRENIDFRGKAITVKSVHGTTSTIIDGNKSGSVVTFSSGEGTKSVLAGFTITNGSATCGGGICCESSSPTITNCTISNNSANYYGGGGIYCCGSSSPTITNCTISNNSANYYCGGGGIYCYSSSPTITNCTISNNSANYCDGGGIYCYGSSSPTITNCTISNNSANYYGGGGIGCYSSSSPTIVNSILWNNSPQEIYLNSGGKITITYSDIKGNWTGTGNLNIDPLFVGTSNYQLQPISFCIDVGLNTAVPAGITTDIDGNPRIANGIVDMGVYEYQGTPTPSATITAIFHNGTTSFGIGSMLIVTMIGQAGGVATFTVSGIATTTMTETSPGTYTGTYTVQAGDDIIDGTVTGYLAIGTTTCTKDATQTVTFDGILPTSTAGSLPAYSGTSSLKIPYIAWDNSGLNHVSLYKMQEGGTWTWHHTYTISGTLTSGTLTCNLSGTNTDGQWFFYTRAKDIVDNIESFTGSDTSIIIDTTKPATPTLTSVENPGLDDKLNISWTPGTDTNLSGYKIYYGTESGTYTQVVDTGSVSTSSTLGSLTNGTCYYIVISAYDKADQESDKSNELSGTPTITGSISVASTPDGANIWLDGVNTGTVTPAILLGIIPGTHTVTLTKAGYYDWIGTITVVAEATTDVVATLTMGSITVWNALGNFIGSYATIQAGIDACPTGGTVSVGDGTYTGTGNKGLTWSEKKIAVRSQNGPNNCIIDCQKEGRGFYLDNAGGCGTISGFTIRNGSATNGGGIYCYNSSPTITDCVLTGNTAAEYGGGIYGTKSSSPSITNCIIRGNIANDCGGGIYCQDHSSPTIASCIIATNTALYGGGIHCENNSSPTITGCTITGNIATTDDGGGIYCEVYSHLTITNCIIATNTANFGGGIFCKISSSPSITNCQITGNTANISGGGIVCCENCSPNIINCIIAMNTAGTHSGGGIYCEENCFPNITNCIIATNTALYGGGIYCVQNSSPTITNNIISSNSGYGIYEDGYTSPSDPPTNYNCFYSNTPSNYRDEGTRTINDVNTIAGNSNNITANPQFIGEGDYHLGTFSYCINTGSNIAPAIPSTDKDGNPRIYNNYIIDMGAYEFQGTPTIIGSVTVWNTLGNFIGTYTTIQAGIDACPEGGTVSVGAGTYTEAIFINKRIALVGDGSSSTIITSAKLGSISTVYFNGIATNNASISNFTITGATGDWPYGCGIYCTNGSPTITNNSISGNSSVGIFCGSSSPTISNNNILGNNAGISCASSSSPTITNNTISKNNDSGIYCYSSFTSITNNIILGNGGSGIYCYYSSPTIATNTITKNSNYGIYCSYSSPAITSNNISGNSNNGIFCFSSSPAIISNSISENNKNGIYCNSSSFAVITSNSISGNSSDGIHCNSSSPIITNNSISGNNSNGISFSDHSTSTITSNIISGNSNAGIFCDYFSSPTITSNTISGNNTGISYNSSSSSIITNNSIVGNNIGIYCNSSSSSDIIITNNTISENNYNGIYCLSGSLFIYNNIIAENGTSSYSYGIGVSSGRAIVDYNCVFGNGLYGNDNYDGCSAGPKDISADPQFIGQGNYHFQLTSPCIDKGTNTAPDIPSSDKDGNLRIADSTVDIGAYEYQGYRGTPLTIIIATQTTLGTISSLPVPGSEITYIITYENIGMDGINNLIITDKPDLTHAEYITGSLRMGTAGSTYETAVSKSDTPNNDEAAWDGGIAIFDAGNISSKEGGRVYFRVRIR